MSIPPILSVHDELEDINMKLRILNDMMNDMRAEEMQQRIQNYDAISQVEQRVVSPVEFSRLKGNALQRWRQYQIDMGYIYDIEELTENIIRDLMSFMERQPRYNNKHFRDILQYLLRKFKSTRKRIGKEERGGLVGISSYVWPLPLENNISDFIEYVDGLEEPSPEGQGKYRKAKHKRKKSRRKRKHKRKKSRKKKSH